MDRAATDGPGHRRVTLVLDAVTLRTARAVLVDDLTVRVAAGEVVTMMGPSGSGKSSLLAFAAGSLAAGIFARGRIVVGGTDVTRWPAHRRRLGMLFQDDLLFPHMSVADNLAFGLDDEVRGRSARRAAVEAALAECELDGFGPRDPATLSGGQRARVALMRALLARPRALLLDEPFAALDAALRHRFRDMVFALAVARRLPVLLVTHDAADAAGRVIDLARVSPRARAD